MLMRSPIARDRWQPPGFIRPALPVLAGPVPAGDGWLHELKHDGFRIVAHKEGDDVACGRGTGGTGRRPLPQLGEGEEPGL